MRDSKRTVARRVRRATVRVSRIVRNTMRDLRHGRPLVGHARSRYEHLGARHPENSDYLALDLVLGGRMRDGDVFVDVGCGKGRVLNWWLSSEHKTNAMWGLELDPDLATATAKRLAKHPNVTVIAGDAVELLPNEATFLYMYNPFTAPVMERFAHAVSERCQAGRTRLVYNNCKHVQVFDDHPAFVVTERHEASTSAVPLDPFAIIELVGPDND